MGFSGWADRMALFLHQIQDGGRPPYRPPSWKISNGRRPICATGDPIHFMFGYRVFRVGGSNGAIADYIKSIRIYLKIIESKSNFSFTRHVGFTI